LTEEKKQLFIDKPLTSNDCAFLHKLGIRARPRQLFLRVDSVSRSVIQEYGIMFKLLSGKDLYLTNDQAFLGRPCSLAHPYLFPWRSGERKKLAHELTLSHTAHVCFPYQVNAKNKGDILSQNGSKSVSDLFCFEFFVFVFAFFPTELSEDMWKEFETTLTDSQEDWKY